MTDRLAALRTSTDHLRTLVTGLDPDALRRPAYPTGWTVADVLSHLGSSAEIFRAGFDAAVAGGTDDPDREAIWAAWNAKSPDRKAADALVADTALIDAFEALPDADRAGFHTTLGPLELDFEGLATRPDLVLPAEAFVRLVYGRLDPDHTPHVSDEAVVARLRAVFPGP